MEGGQGAAGSTYEQLVLTNTGHQPCTTGGFAGVSYVGSGDGTQIGAAARRVHRGQVHWFVLAPGERAQATLRAANAENYPPERCDPTRADGLRVYPPDQTAAAFVPQSTLACAKPGARLLSIGPFHQGH